MKKKRFKKLLMSKGVSRNDAEFYSKNVVSEGKTYKEVYLIYSTALKLNVNINSLTQGFKAIQTVAKSVVSACSAFIKAFNDTMKESVSVYYEKD